LAIFGIPFSAGRKRGPLTLRPRPGGLPEALLKAGAGAFACVPAALISALQQFINRHACNV
jgi:hypothetical protein